MKVKLRFAIIVLIGVIIVISFWKSCRNYWSPHYLNNKAIMVGRSLFNRDSSVAIVYYTLDIGARGTADYQTILRKDDYDGDLSKFLLPNEYISPKWRGTDTLEVVYDEYIGMGGPLTNMDRSRDTVSRNGVVIIVKERRMNKEEMLKKDYPEFFNDSTKILKDTN